MVASRGVLLSTLCLALLHLHPTLAQLPRFTRVEGLNFVDGLTDNPVVLSGPNVVVKGPPYLPSVSGSTFCSDTVDDACSVSGTCSTCSTFNSFDVANIKSHGWNSIRLGVTWAGAQPVDADELDADFLSRLHKILSLCDESGITVILDNHGDMVGSANCGNGVPMWISELAAPLLIGKPLKTSFPYNLKVVNLDVEELGGYEVCGDDEGMWAMFAGDPNYNLLNPCCIAMNAGGNPASLGFTTLSQRTMDYIISAGPGRDAFVRYWRLMAEAVVDHPSASLVELMNEPMTIHRTNAFDTWKAAGEAITNVIPDMAISVMDTGEGVILPDWVLYVTHGTEDISPETLDWIKSSNNVFYAWHWYGVPAVATDAVKEAQTLGNDWNVPTMATEFMDCAVWKACVDAGISHSYWHYSAYCNTGSSFSAMNLTVPTETFGACILGWGGGTSQYTCD